MRWDPLLMQTADEVFRSPIDTIILHCTVPIDSKSRTWTTTMIIVLGLR